MFLDNILLFMLLAFPLSENTAAINGSVVNQDNKPIINSRIILLQSDSYITVATVRTDKSGFFTLNEIEPGEYVILAWRLNHAPWVGQLKVDEKQTATINIKLSPAPEKKFIYKYVNPGQDDLDSFSPALDALKEPHFCSNAAISQKYESYRFLYLRSFHQPVLIHLKYDTDTASVIIKELEGEDYSEFGSLSEVTEIDLRKKWSQSGTPAELHRNMLDNISKEAQELFWEQPFKIDAGIIGLDGADWIIEGIKNGKCHVVTRWSPEKGTPIRAFADNLIHLSGKRFYYDEVY